MTKTSGQEGCGWKSPFAGQGFEGQFWRCGNFGTRLEVWRVLRFWYRVGRNGEKCGWVGHARQPCLVRALIFLSFVVLAWKRLGQGSKIIHTATSSKRRPAHHSSPSHRTRSNL